MMQLDSRRRRLLFRANHRGTHENDLMIGGYIAPRIAGFTDSELEALEELLELPDVALADWLSGRREITGPLAGNAMLLAIRADVAAGGAVRLP
jgi:antitoxin CptB